MPPGQCDFLNYINSSMMPPRPVALGIVKIWRRSVVGSAGGLGQAALSGGTGRRVGAAGSPDPGVARVGSWPRWGSWAC